MTKYLNIDQFWPISNINSYVKLIYIRMYIYTNGQYALSFYTESNKLFFKLEKEGKVKYMSYIWTESLKHLTDELRLNMKNP